MGSFLSAGDREVSTSPRSAANPTALRFNLSGASPIETEARMQRLGESPSGSREKTGINFSARLNHCTGHVTSANPHEAKNPNCLRISPHRPCRSFSHPIPTNQKPQTIGARPMTTNIKHALETASLVTHHHYEPTDDEQRQSFLDMLHVQSSLANTKGKICLGDWLFHWIEDRVNSPRPFSDSDRTFIDKLRSQHEHKI
jgi:hypothetical protein